MEEEIRENNNTLNIVLIVVGVLVFGALVFLIGLNFSHDQTEEEITFYEENRTTKEISGALGDNGLNGNSSNSSEGEGEKIVYHDNGEKWAEAKSIFNEDGDLAGREIIIYDEKGNKIGEGRGEFYDYNFMYGQGERVIYDDQGNKRIEIRGNLNGSRLNGRFIYYDENGNKKIDKKGNFTIYEMAGAVLPFLPRIKELTDKLQMQDLIKRLQG